MSWFSHERFIPVDQVSISKGYIILYMEVILGDGSCNSLSLFNIVYPCLSIHVHTILIFAATHFCKQKKILSNKEVSLMHLASAEAT